ncbi:MAG: hemerythrin domain-containing protein [Bacteroides sp.]|nr:hemerythrin domain-containing protein [Bacteroides sp.]MCM1085542.1 hemerythrin domain-containing protein [Bacteroides sp.]
MNTKTRYTEDDKMCALVCSNHYMLFVLSRFGIPMGFGDATIGEVCRKNRIDVPTFLAVVNLSLSGRLDRDAGKIDLNPEAIVRYLHNSHEYFLNYRLPTLRANLSEVICGKDQQDVVVVVMRFFDEYAAEVKKHMQYEEKTVFPYIRALVQGKADSGYHIEIFRKQHNQIESRLTELRDILLKYYAGKTGHEFNATLFDIFTCAEDLRQHNTLEDVLLVPLIERIEKAGGR